MAACDLLSSIKKGNCTYDIAGIKAIYLFNYGDVTYTFEGEVVPDIIEELSFKQGKNAYKVDFIEASASFTDDLAVNGNGGKYRTHTLNFSLSNYVYESLNQNDALSLGKFSAVVVTKKGQAILLGRTNGLSATAFNYASGAADADAVGWTVTLAGTEVEVGRLLKDEEVIAQHVEDTVVIPEP